MVHGWDFLDLLHVETFSNAVNDIQLQRNWMLLTLTCNMSSECVHCPNVWQKGKHTSLHNSKEAFKTPDKDICLSLPNCTGNH